MLIATTIPSGSLADPAGSGAIVAAVNWLQATLLGTVATTVAVIAVAWMGLMMLAGRIELRRGLNVILGCFVLFGASAIAAGIQAAAGRDPGTARYVPGPLAPPPSPQPPAPPPANRDPYAGASVPER